MGIEEKVVAIVCGGEINNLNWLKEQLNSCNFIIAADSGFDWCCKCNILPDVVIGDLDSVNTTINQDVEVIKFPSKKDKTDFSLCLDYCLNNGYKTVNVFGAIGGRVDHTLGAILSALEAFNFGLNVVIETESSSLFFVSNSITLNKTDSYVSVFAIGGDAEGVTLEGFEYPLTNYSLKCTSPLGVSNHIVANSAKISVKSGDLLVIVQK